MQGFSLIEIVVVMAIMTIVLSCWLFFSSDTYQRSAFLAERDLLITALQIARADAQNNIHQKPHGVAILPPTYDGYVIFEGVDYEQRDTTSEIFIPAS